MALVESFSGIRGIYGKDLTSKEVIHYAHSYVSFLRKKTRKKNVNVVIGRDTRPSGKAIKDEIISLMDCNFIEVGIAATPVVEFAVRNFNADGGIIITASHNEPFWNGFKFLSETGQVLSEKEMNRVIAGSKKLADFYKISERKVIDKSNEAMKDYYKFVKETVGTENLALIKKSGLKVLVDPNGGTGIAAISLLKEIGVNVVSINDQHGEFNRTVEPTEDSLFYLSNIINEKNADFAAGFDCDADRVEIMMNNGKLISGNYILALVVDDVLSAIKNPKGKIVVVNDATSAVVKKVAEKCGAKVKEVEVGETNVVSEMYKLKSPVGGEGSSSGAITPPSRCRDGILTLVQILSIVSKKKQILEKIVEALPKFYTLRGKISFDLKKHDSIKKHLKDYYSKKGFEIKETGGMKGGLKAVDGDSFIWFRASKTEGNVFRIISDSDNEATAKELLCEAVGVFNKSNAKH